MAEEYGYGMRMPTGGNYPGRGVGRFIEGVKAGLSGGRQAEMQELQMEGMREDREYTRGQRTRQSKLQSMEDQQKEFSKTLEKSLGVYVASNGAQYQSLVDTINSISPDGSKMAVSRNKDGTFSVAGVDAGGNPIGTPSKISFDDLGKRAYMLKNPEVYFQHVFKTQDQKGRYAESERGVLDTASGTFKPHGPGTKKGKVDESAKHQRLLTNDAVNILQSHFGGRFEGGMWFPDEENRDVAMNAIEIASDLIQEGETPQRAANLAAAKAKQGALPKSRRTAAPGANPSQPPKDAESYFKALRSAPQNQGVSDEDLRAYVNQKFQAQ